MTARLLETLEEFLRVQRVGHTMKQRRDALAALKDAFAEAKRGPWVPITSGLPDADRWYIVTRQSVVAGRERVDRAHHIGNGVWSMYGEGVLEPGVVIAWQPEPEPYRPISPAAAWPFPNQRPEGAKTPGPWSVSQTGEIRGGYDRRTVAYVRGPSANSAADGHLIAAAPDLLAALQAIYNRHDSESMAKARAAMTKATGSGK